MGARSTSDLTSGRGVGAVNGSQTNSNGIIVALSFLMIVMSANVHAQETIYSWEDDDGNINCVIATKCRKQTHMCFPRVTTSGSCQRQRCR